jgi:hypothetical protein
MDSNSTSFYKTIFMEGEQTWTGIWQNHTNFTVTNDNYGSGPWSSSYANSYNPKANRKGWYNFSSYYNSSNCKNWTLTKWSNETGVWQNHTMECRPFWKNETLNTTEWHNFTAENATWHGDGQKNWTYKVNYRLSDDCSNRTLYHSN